jgi:Cu(I)/Ag(I) efflux system membrane protein CusA/SilA
LKRKLLLTLVETTVDLIQGAGLLTADPTRIPLVEIVAEALPATHAGHLGMDPSLADVTLLAQATVKVLEGRGWTAPGADLTYYRAGWWWRPVVALHVALGGRPPTFFTQVHAAVHTDFRREWQAHTDQLDAELRERGAALFTRLTLEDLLDRLSILDPTVTAYQQQVRQARRQPSVAGGHVHGHEGRHSFMTTGVTPHPDLSAIQNEQTQAFARRLLLWKKDRSDLIGFGGELDRAMQMPGWTNVWTLPIQNRVDMLATGVNTTVGVRVLGRKLEDVVSASEAIAAALKGVPGAADVIADPVRGKGYLEVRIDRDKAAQHGVTADDVNDWVETALGGKPATVVTAGRERQPVRVRLPRNWREDESTLRQLPVRSRLPNPGYVALQQVANVRILEGPAAIKSENGLLRNYVRLNVRGRDEAEFVEEARQVVAARVALPAGVFVEWTGQFEQIAHARSTLAVVVPLAIGLIVLLLYWTYRDLADALLMLLAVPGALAGGVLFQWLFGCKFSVTVWVGYIACFGMATSTGIIMLVYLREAVAQAGGLDKLSLEQLREAVMRGAVQRLRPKLLTEATTVIGLAPLLWADGVGAEVIRPMAAPVLGGILIADEMIDLLLPVLFYHVRKWRWNKLQSR